MGRYPPDQHVHAVNFTTRAPPGQCKSAGHTNHEMLPRHAFLTLSRYALCDRMLEQFIRTGFGRDRQPLLPRMSILQRRIVEIYGFARKIPHF